MRLYTKTGDRGETGLVGGERVSKDCRVIQLVGDLDELNCTLALALQEELDPESCSLILAVQSRLFDGGAEAASRGAIPGSYEGLVEEMERAIDARMDALPALKFFILPGGSAAAARLHHARAVCRRVERSAVSAAQEGFVTPKLLVFLNRLSDWLFTSARWENHRRQIEDVPWTKQS